MHIELSEENTIITLTIPASFKRRGSRRLIIAPNISLTDGEILPKENIQDQKLVKAVVRAFHWQEWIERGKYADTHELASKEKIERSYAVRIMRLTLLAPDIIEHIIAGTQPRELTLQKIIRGFPIAWNEQRTKFGFSEPDNQV